MKRRRVNVDEEPGGRERLVRNPRIASVVGDAGASRGIAMHIANHKEYAKFPPRALPFTDASGKVPNQNNRKNIQVRYNSKDLWDLYHRDPVISIFVDKRNRELFAHGWNISMQETTPNNETLVEEVVTQHTQEYVDTHLTPFFKKALAYLDCFGICPYYFIWLNNELVPVIPELGTFGIKVWINGTGQLRYTYEVYGRTDESEDKYGRDRQETMDRLNRINDPTAPLEAGSNNASGNPYEDFRRRQVTEEDVRRAEDALKRVTQTNTSINDLLSQNTGSVFRNLKYLDLDDETSMEAARLKEIFDQFQETTAQTRPAKLTEHTFFLVAKDADYNTCEFRSVMSTLFETAVDFQEMRRLQQAVAKRQAKPVLAYEENTAARSAGMSNNSIDPVVNAVVSDVNRHDLGPPGESMNVDTNAFATQMREATGANDMLETGAGPSDIAYRNLRARAANETRGMLNQTSSMLGGAPHDTFMRDGVLYSRPDILVPPGQKLVNLQSAGTAVNYQQVFEQYTQIVASNFGQTSSSMTEPLTRGGLGNGSGNTMHEQSNNITQQSLATMLSSHARMILRMMVDYTSQSEEGMENFNPNAYSVPLDQVYIKDGPQYFRPVDDGTMTSRSYYTGPGRMMRSHIGTLFDNRDKPKALYQLQHAQCAPYRAAILNAVEEDTHVDTELATDRSLDTLNRHISRMLYPRLPQNMLSEAGMKMAAEQDQQFRDFMDYLGSEDTSRKRKLPSAVEVEEEEEAMADDDSDSDEEPSLKRVAILCATEGIKARESKKVPRGSRSKDRLVEQLPWLMRERMMEDAAARANDGNDEVWGRTLQIHLRYHNNVPMTTVMSMAQNGMISAQQAHEYIFDQTGLHRNGIRQESVRQMDKFGTLVSPLELERHQQEMKSMVHARKMAEQTHELAKKTAATAATAAKAAAAAPAQQASSATTTSSSSSGAQKPAEKSETAKKQEEKKKEVEKKKKEEKQKMEKEQKEQKEQKQKKEKEEQEKKVKEEKEKKEKEQKKATETKK